MSDKLEKLEVGQIVEGKVVNIKPFGALVVLPDGSQGLVHISHISSGFVQNVSDYIAVGDEVRVKIVSVDSATKKISLSMKDAMAPGEAPPRPPMPKPGTVPDSRPKGSTFEEKIKEWVKVSNERQAGLNKRNKRR